MIWIYNYQINSYHLIVVSSPLAHKQFLIFTFELGVRVQFGHTWPCRVKKSSCSNAFALSLMNYYYKFLFRTYAMIVQQWFLKKEENNLCGTQTVNKHLQLSIKVSSWWFLYFLAFKNAVNSPSLHLSSSGVTITGNNYFTLYVDVLQISNMVE